MSTATARITLDEYHTMAEKGLLRPDSKDYLWHGEVVEVMPQNPPHVAVAQNLGDCLRDLFPRQAYTVREERPFPLPDDSEPIPDLVVARGHKSIYVARHPRPDEVELLVEVAYSSLKDDLARKLPDYAAAGIPRYWVADIENRLLLTFWDPDQNARMYRSSRFLTRGQAADTPNGPVLVDDIFAHLP